MRYFVLISIILFIFALLRLNQFMTPYQSIIQSLTLNANAQYAIAQEAYLKHKFKCYGINTTLRRAILSDLKKQFSLTVVNDDFLELMDTLWNDEHRECQHIALDLLHINAKKLNTGHLPFMEYLITHKSWWDSVDGIAPHLVGSIMMQNKDAIPMWIPKWMDSNNIWLQRSAIIFQLKYGKKTDWDLLCEAILKHDKSPEFFVRKAQGWALRQYSKFEPQKVLEFVECNPQLSGLTKREAIRNIK